MEIVHVVIGLALLEYFVFGMIVGWARGKFKVEAPAVSGHPVFERYFRVQQNTLEQIVIFVPSAWLFAQYVNPRWAAILGAIYIVGRIVYLTSYVADPKKRSLGFGLSMFPTLILLFGAIYGAAKATM